MKTYQAIFIIVSLVLTSQAYSFEGYDKFPMRGNSIFPLTDVDAKLLSIDTLMERTDGKGRATRVKSEYTLENLSSKEINFKVAFPVESDCLNCTQMPDDFKVSVNNKTTQTSTSKIASKDFFIRIYKAQRSQNVGSQKKIEEYEIPLIVWDVILKPKEKKIVSTTYTMEWLLDPGSEYFELDLCTLCLWKGNIDKAYFRLALPKELIDNIKSHDPSIWPKITIDPKKYQIKDHALEWSFKDLKKEKIYDISIDVDYHKPGVVGE